MENTIHEWSTCRPGSPYIAPEQRPLCLQGMLANDHVRTSRIVKAEGRIVTTRSGSVYRLGRIDRKFRRWLESGGRDYDPYQPIVVGEG